MPPRQRALTSSSFTFSSLFRQQQPQKSQKNPNRSSGRDTGSPAPTLEQVLASIQEHPNVSAAVHLLQLIEDEVQISYNDFESAIKKLLVSEHKEILGITLRVFTKHLQNHTTTVTSLQRLTLFELLKPVNSQLGLKLEALKALFLSQAGYLSGFEDILVKHLKTLIELILDLDQSEGRTAILELWESYSHCVEVVTKSMVNDSAKKDIERFYARLIYRLLIKLEDDGKPKNSSDDLVAGPPSASSTDPRRPPTPPPTTITSTNTHSSPPTKEKHFHHTGPGMGRSISISGTRGFLGHRRHPSSGSSNKTNLSLNVSPVRMNSFSSGGAIPPTSPTQQQHSPYSSVSPILTSGSGSSSTPNAPIAPSHISAQLHLQALISAYLDFLSTPTLWDEDLLRRVLPVLFSVQGMWATGEPLPRIGVGKEREHSTRAKSQTRNGRRKSGGREVESEMESEMESLKRRVEKAIASCCEGIYEWVVLEVIKESACPNSRHDCGADDNTTPTPSIAHVAISKVDEGFQAETEAEAVIDKEPTKVTQTKSPTESSEDPSPYLRPLGALRTLHLQLRDRLHSILMSSYVHNLGGDGMTQSGGFAGIDEQDVEMMRVVYSREAKFGKDNLEGSSDEGRDDDDDYGSWNVGVCKEWLAQTVDKWVGLPEKEASKDVEGVEMILNEILSIMKDILQVVNDLAEYGSSSAASVDMGIVVSEVLARAVLYVKRVKNPDGTPYILPLDLPRDAPTLLLQTISSLLDPQYLPVSSSSYTAFHSTSIPDLAQIALSITPHLSDIHTARMPSDMDLLPVTNHWLKDFRALFECFCSSNTGADVPPLFNDLTNRDLSREAVFKRAAEVWGIVRDWKGYRKPLADLVFEFWTRVGGEAGEASPEVWKMFGQEYAIRLSEKARENQEEPSLSQEDEEKKFDPEDILTYMIDTASRCQCHSQPRRAETERASKAPTSGDTPPYTSATSSAFTSPVISRVQSQQQPTPPVAPSSTSSPSLRPGTERLPSEVCDDAFCQGALATLALLNIFSTLSFSPDPLAMNAQMVFTALLHILSTTSCNRCRLLVLQYTMRLRADRNHRVFLVGNIDDEVLPLARQLGFAVADDSVPKTSDFVPEDVSGRQASHSVGPYPSISRSRPASRGGRFSSPTSTSRSRSRASEPVHPAVSITTTVRHPLWYVPESLNFWLPDRELEDDLIFIQPSPAILTYEALTDSPSKGDQSEKPNSLSLLVSEYVNVLTEILEYETEWDILAYVLTHLTLQLANKHFFCGPLARESIQRLQQVICTSLAQETLGLSVRDLPFSLHPRSAQSVGYHILSVLISYSPMFDSNRLDIIVRVLCEGIRAGMESTITCCISALSLCAFELRTQVARHLPTILEMLERIMSNAAVAAHVLGFLGIVGSIPELYSNFTEDHFRQVFAISLKYLEAHNDPEANSGLPFALTQHVLLMTFNVIYTWFLALNLEDRPRFVRYITRHVLLASNNELTEQAEVCFDWLARYTYATVDSKPAPSLLRESVMLEDDSIRESHFLMGKAIISIKNHGYKGWLEITVRRASGMTRFLCHTQNHPIVPAGDPKPDLISLSAAASENRVPARMLSPSARAALSASEADSQIKSSDKLTNELLDILTAVEQKSEVTEAPNSLTGYVWIGTAPSQRRKAVSSYPGFFAMQLSPYPDNIEVMRSINITELKGLKRSIEAIDRVPVIDIHTVGVLYVGPEQKDANVILSNQHGSPAYTRFLRKLGRLVQIGGQQDVYTGGLDPDVDGEYTIAWWDDIEQLVYHVTTLMPNKTTAGEDTLLNKRAHVGNGHVKIVWNDSGLAYEFTTIPGQFNSVNIIIEPHSFGTIAAYSDDGHENEYFKVYMQRQENMPDFGSPIGDFKIVSAVSLPLFVRRVSFLADWFCKVYSAVEVDKTNPEFITNWRYRLQSIKRLKERAVSLAPAPPADLAESYDFTRMY